MPTAGSDSSEMEPGSVLPPVQPYDIALDVSGGKIYWAGRVAPLDGLNGVLQRANLDGTGMETIVERIADRTGDPAHGLGNPTSIAVDPGGGKVYWSDVQLETINRATLTRD